MEDSKNCQVGTNCWTFRFELVGLVLVILATILTLLTLSGLGIAAMFLVGAALCCHKCFGHCHCNGHSHLHSHRMDDVNTELEITPPPKVVKTTTTRRTKPVDKL